MLRGPQTVGELKGRTERQHRFESIDAVAAVLAALAGRDRAARAPARSPTRPEGCALGAPARRRSTCREPATPDLPNGRRCRAAAPADPYGEATAEFYDLLATGDVGRRSACSCSTCSPTSTPPTGRSSTSAAARASGLRYLRAAVPGARRVRDRAVEGDAGRPARPAHDVRPSCAQRRRWPRRRSATRALPEQASAMVALGRARPPHRRRAHAAVAYVADADAVPGAPAVVGVLPPDRVRSPSIRLKYARAPDRRLRLRGLAVGCAARRSADDVDDDATRSSTRDGHDCRRVRRRRPVAVRLVSTTSGARSPPYGLTLTEHDDCVVVRRPA